MTVLNQIYEEDFLGFSYGFRPGRKQHDALDALAVGLRRKKVNWILDLDVRGFFDHVSHEWLEKFVEHRIADRRLIRLIQKWLKAGVSEEGEWKETKVGTPQGAVASPLLANIYLHYVFDLWVNQWRRKWARGDMIVVRYADDAVLGKVGLDHPPHHRFGGAVGLGDRIEIEVRALVVDQERGAEERQNGFARSGRRMMLSKSSSMRSKLQAVRQELRKRWHERIAETGDWLRSVVQGYFNDHAVPGNFRALQTFRREVARAWLAALRRRSQRHCLPWERFRSILDRYLPLPRILHPEPGVRFDAMHPR